ncbi:unnamed protein product [Trichobilharzia szidati]|nr:unnamed protein product [Trichobilharzia szidati]
MLGNEFTVIPVCNINRADMILRTEVTFWLTQCGLKWEELIYVDDLFSGNQATTLNENQASLILVDHHLPSEKFSELPIVEIIDHHQQQITNNQIVENCPFKQIDLVGSCSSLVTLEILKGIDGSELPVSVWKLLYGAILIDTIGLSSAGQTAGRLTELDYRMACRIEDIICDQLFTPSISRNTLFTQLEAAKFDVQGLSTWDLLRRDMKIASNPDNDKCRIVCSTVSGVDFQVLAGRSDFVEAANRMCTEYNTTILICITVGYPPGDHSSAPPSELTAFRRRAVIFYNMDAPIQYYNALLQYFLDPKHNLQLVPQSIPGFNHFTAIVNNIKVTRKTVLPLLIHFLQQSESLENTKTTLVDNSRKNDEHNNNDDDNNNNNNKPMEDNNQSEENTKRSQSPDTNLKCSSKAQDQNKNTTEFVSKDVVLSLRNWLIPLRPRERCEFLRSCRQSSLNPDESPSLDLLNCLWTSIFREIGNTSHTMKYAVGTQTPLPKLVWLKSRQTRRVASMIHGRNSVIKGAPNKMENFKSSRRFTLSDIKDLSPHEEIPSLTSKNDMPTIRLLRNGSDENLSVSDSENTKPSWLETEYLTRIPAWLPTSFISTSLDSAEAISYRLYRRLSSMSLCRNFDDDIPPLQESGQVLSTTLNKNNLDTNKLEADELALLRTSLTDFTPLLYLDKETSTSGLCSYMNWSSSQPDYITERGLKYLKLGSHVQSSKADNISMKSTTPTENLSASSTENTRIIVSGEDMETFLVVVDFTDLSLFLFHSISSIRRSICILIFCYVPSKIIEMQRTRAVAIFKKLHRTCQKVFKGDYETLQAAREKINSEFRANRNETDPEKVDELLKTAEDSELLIRTTVIQMELVDEDKNVYRMNLRDDLAYRDNEPSSKEK